MLDFTPFQRCSWNTVRPCDVCHGQFSSKNHDITANKRLDQDAPTSAHICTFLWTDRLLIFIQIVNVPDLHFKSKHFQSSALGSSNVIISQTVTDRTNIATASTESRIRPFDWHLHLTFAHSKGQRQGHVHFEC